MLVSERLGFDRLGFDRFEMGFDGGLFGEGRFRFRDDEFSFGV